MPRSSVPVRPDPGILSDRVSPRESSLTVTVLVTRDGSRFSVGFRFQRISLYHSESPTCKDRYEVTSTKVQFGRLETCRTSEQRRWGDSSRGTTDFTDAPSTPEDADPKVSRHRSQSMGNGQVEWGRVPQRPSVLNQGRESS